MGPRFTRSLVEILRSTLEKLEEGSEFRRDDPAVIELNRHMVRAIAELEMIKARHSIEAEQYTIAPDENAPAASTPGAGTKNRGEKHTGSSNPGKSGAGALVPAAAVAPSETSVAEPASEGIGAPVAASKHPAGTC